MSKLNTTRVARLAVLLAMFALGASTLMAQSTVDGAIGGTVTDQTHAVVAGASVTVRNLDTNQEFTGVTDETGAYRISHLRPGRYVIDITSGNFSPFKADGIVVEVGRVTSVEAKLAVAGKGESVEVSGEAPVINTVQPDYTTNVNLQSLQDLPINARRYSSFALGTPGATADGSFGLVSYRGLSGLLNSNTVDGGDNNTAYWSEERGRTRATSTISQDSVREYQVNTSNFSAEYGHAAGGVVNAVTKSGTNQLHGGGRLFITDSALWAYNPFSKDLAGNPLKPADRRYQFGASIGGPIKKDKLFFFFNWDQQKEQAPGVAITPNGFLNPITVSAPASCSSTSLTAGQTLSCRGISQATTNKALAFIGGLTGQVDRNKDHWIIFPKVDWLINSKNTLTASWNHMRWNSIHGIQTAATVFYGTNSWGDDFVDVDTGNARLVSLLSNKVSNEFRLSIGRELQHENSNPPGPGEPTTGLNGKPPYTTVTGTGGTFNMGKANFLERAALPLENRKQFTDIVSMVSGTHNFKFGFDFNHTNDYISNLFQEGGQYSYSTLQDFITDYAGFIGDNATKLCGGFGCYSSFAQGLGPVAYSYSTNDYAAFIQDDWHALPRLTVNLGFRWDYQQFPSPFWPNAKLNATAAIPRDRGDFGPRLGFAYDVTGDGKTVVRGGWGLYYGRVINAYIANELTGTGSPQSQLSTGSLRNNAAAAPVWPYILDPKSALPSSAPPSVNEYGLVRLPRIHEADFIVEREIARNTVVSFSYLFTAGQRLPEVFDINLPASTQNITYAFNGGPLAGTSQTYPVYSGSRPNSAFSSMYSLQYVGHSRYNGQVLQLTRRMTSGLQLDFAYTHARATDSNPNGGTGATSMSVVDPAKPYLDSGTSSFDIRHKVGFDAIYQPKINGDSVLAKLVNGFTISPTFGISSGAPYSASISGSAPCTRLATDTLGAAGTVCASTTASSNKISPISSGFNGSNGIFRLPTMARNSFRYPTTASANMRVARKFAIREGKNVEFLAEVFNLTNHINYTSVNSTYYSLSSVANQMPAMNYNTSFGSLNQANNQDRVGSTPREFQFGLRFEF
jgi:hypothetical protein